MSSDRNMIVIPFVTGRVIGFSKRTILRKDTHIDPKILRRALEAWRDREQGRERLDRPSPANDHDPLPPPPPLDPNFDCAAVLEAGAANPETGCYPAPSRRH